MTAEVYDYLVASKAISADGAEMGALKSLKAVKFFKERNSTMGCLIMCMCMCHVAYI